MPRPKKLANPRFAAETVSFLNIAYSDYLAARVLLNAELLPQGAVLASTAIEKYFKSILAFRGNEARGHLSKRHIKNAINYDRRISETLNMSFLELLQAAYQIRYVDNLPDEFNLVIAYREFIAELDHTAMTIQKSFKIQFDGVDAMFRFNADIENQNPHLVVNNHILQGQSKSEFIAAEPQPVYEMRKCPVRGILEARYTSTLTKSDGQFLREGCRRVNDEAMQYQLALPPILPPPNAT